MRWLIMMKHVKLLVFPFISPNSNVSPQTLCQWVSFTWCIDFTHLLGDGEAQLNDLSFNVMSSLSLYSVLLKNTSIAHLELHAINVLPSIGIGT